MRAIRTRFYPAENGKPTRIRATWEYGSVTVTYDEAFSLESNHRIAARKLTDEQERPDSSWDYTHGVFHGDYYWVEDSGMLDALRKLVKMFQTGTHYDSKNPYTRPEVVQALQAIADAAGFKGNPLESNDEFARQPE